MFTWTQIYLNHKMGEIGMDSHETQLLLFMYYSYKYYSLFYTFFLQKAFLQNV